MRHHVPRPQLSTCIIETGDQMQVNDPMIDDSFVWRDWGTQFASAMTVNTKSDRTLTARYKAL